MARLSLVDTVGNAGCAHAQLAMVDLAWSARRLCTLRHRGDDVNGLSPRSRGPLGKVATQVGSECSALRREGATRRTRSAIERRAAPRAH